MRGASSGLDPHGDEPCRRKIDFVLQPDSHEKESGDGFDGETIQWVVPMTIQWVVPILDRASLSGAHVRLRICEVLHGRVVQPRRSRFVVYLKEYGDGLHDRPRRACGTEAAKMDLAATNKYGDKCASQTLMEQSRRRS